MKVRISYTIEVDDDIRRKINAWYGRPGLASRDEVKRWYEANGLNSDDDLGGMQLFDSPLVRSRDEQCSE